MRATAALLLLSSLLVTALVVGGQKTPKPSALQNVTITSVEDGDNYCLNVDFDYSGSGVCKCDVKSVQGRKKKSFGSVKQCMGKFTMLVGAGMYLVDIKCKSGKSSTTVSVPDDKECPTLEDIPNGSVDMTGVTVGSTATYTCNDNYQLMGSSTRMCQPDGTWSGEEPMCIVPREKMCESLETLAHNILTTTQGTKCTVSANCLDLTCTGRRSFGAIQNLPFVATIHLFPCANPPAFRFRVDGVGRNIMDGVFSKTTNVTGKLNAIPYEITISVTQLPSGVTLAVDMEILGQRVPLSPDGPTSVIHMSCSGDCGHPGEIDNGQVDVSGGTMIGDTAKYQCNEHFELKGNNNRTCQEDGTWSGTAPTCLVPFESMCESHKNLGKVLEEESGGTCVLSDDCRTMHCSVQRDVMPGQTADTNVSHTLMPCHSPNTILFRPATTGPPVLLTGGTSISSIPGPIPGTAAEIKIHMAQKPFGVAVSSIASIRDEEVVNIPLTDLKMACTCPLLPDISDGTVTQPEVATVGTTASYKCNPTFILDGLSVRTCQSDGRWSGGEPTCRNDKECPTLEDIPNGSVDMTGVTVGSTATYTCNDNYQLKGASTRMCQPDGTWSGEEPMCIVTKEKMGQSLESIGQSILSISETGYCEVSEDYLHMNCTYQKTFNISGVVVVQEMHLFPCAKPPAIYIKVNVPTLGTFIDEVFTESKNITLLSNGVPAEARIGIEQRPQRIAVNAEVEILGRIIHITPENAENEICMSCPGDCRHPGEIDNGQVDVSGGTMIGDTAKYQCNECFELKGNNNRTCQEDGTWSGTPPTCYVSADSMCESQMNMAALLKARSQGGVGRCNISSDCLALQCAGLQSYVLYSIGTRLLPCQTPFGVFVRVLARGITFINVVITQTTVFQFVNTVGVTATVRIEVEQKPFGMTIAATVTVEGKEVFSIPPTDMKMVCVCPMLPNIANGVVRKPDVATVGSQTFYKCNPTYELNGDVSRTCHPNGRWTGSQPSCEGTRETMCSSVRMMPANIQTHPRLSGKCNISDDCLTTECDVTFSLGLVKINSTMKITLMPCTEPYAIRLQASSPEISTHIDGVFTETTVIQRQVAGISVQMIISITQTDTGIILGVTMNFPGNQFVLLSSVEIFMYCICPALSFDCGTVTLSDGYEVGSIATYECDESYELSGHSKRYCLPDGTWSGDEPKCDATQEAMCTSVQETINQTLSSLAIDGSCEISDDCTETVCSLMTEIGASNPIAVNTRTIYNPCQMPLSFRLVLTIPLLGVNIDETMSENSTVTIGGLNQISFVGIQECSTMTISATAIFFGRHFNIIPTSTLYLHCSK